MWLTKDTNLPEPIPISAEKEQGSYLFWNPQQWGKLRVRRGLRLQQPAYDVLINL